MLATHYKSEEQTRHDVGIKTIGEHLLRGWMLLDGCCPNPGCNLPLMATSRTPDAPRVCVLCDDEMRPHPPGGMVTVAPYGKQQHADQHHNNNATSSSTTSTTVKTVVKGSSLADNDFVGAFPERRHGAQQHPEQYQQRDIDSNHMRKSSVVTIDSTTSSRTPPPGSDRITKLIGEKLLAGWTLLGEENPHDSPACKRTPLMRDLNGLKYCLGCGQYTELAVAERSDRSVTITEHDDRKQVAIIQEPHVDGYVNTMQSSQSGSSASHTDAKKVSQTTTTTTKVMRTIRKKDRHGNIQVYTEEVPETSRSISETKMVEVHSEMDNKPALEVLPTPTATPTQANVSSRESETVFAKREIVETKDGVQTAASSSAVEFITPKHEHNKPTMVEVKAKTTTSTADASGAVSSTTTTIAGETSSTAMQLTQTPTEHHHHYYYTQPTASTQSYSSTTVCSACHPQAHAHSGYYAPPTAYNQAISSQYHHNRDISTSSMGSVSQYSAPQYQYYQYQQQQQQQQQDQQQQHQHQNADATKSRDVVNVSSTLNGQVNETLVYLERHLAMLNKTLASLTASSKGHTMDRKTIDESEKVYQSILKCLEAIKACKATM